MKYKCKALLANETGWITEADIIIGFESLSQSEQTHRKNRKVYIDPALNTLRLANLRYGISYIVSLEGHKYRFYHLDDIWQFKPIQTAATCDHLYFVGTIVSGLVWESDDVKVWMTTNKKEV
jgi:hypothetical protein